MPDLIACPASKADVGLHEEEVLALLGEVREHCLENRDPDICRLHAEPAGKLDPFGAQVHPGQANFPEIAVHEVAAVKLDLVEVGADEKTVLERAVGKCDLRDCRLGRSEERRVGKECVSKCRSRWSPFHYKKKNSNIKINNNKKY